MANALRGSRLRTVGGVVLGAMLSAWTGGCEQDQSDDAVYVRLTLDQKALSILGDGDVALTFMALNGDSEFCGPKWGGKPEAWEADPRCKDEWRKLSEIGSEYVWRIEAKGYQWVTVLVEIFDGSRVTRFRGYRTLVPGGAKMWDLNVTSDNLCADVQPFDCCSEGRIEPCLDGNETGWNPGALAGVDWCTESNAHRQCPLSLITR